MYIKFNTLRIGFGDKKNIQSLYDINFAYACDFFFLKGAVISIKI